MAWGIGSITGSGLGSAISGLFGSSGGSSSGGGFWSGVGNFIGGLFGSGGSGGGSGSNNNIWGSLLSGLGGAASGYLSGKDLKEGIEARGKEDRRTIDFEYQLKDFYQQKDKVRKRAALDTFGQFSLTDRFAPGMKNTAPGVDLPNKPGV